MGNEGLGDLEKTTSHDEGHDLHYAQTDDDENVAAALPLGAEELAEVQGLTAVIAAAAGAAFTERYVQGLK